MIDYYIMVKTRTKITTSINFTWAEHELIARKAAELHISNSALIRALLFPKLEKREKVKGNAKM